MVKRRDREWLMAAARGDIVTNAALRQVQVMRAQRKQGILPHDLDVALREGDAKYPDVPERFVDISLGPERVEGDPSVNAAFDQRARELAESEDADPDDLLRSWYPVDLTAALNGEKVRPEPTILRRSDGKALFYEGQVNYLHGTDGVGKSYVALFAAVEVLEDGGHVWWLDYEDPDEVTVVGRLLDLGVKPDVIAHQFHYLHPETEATPTAVAMVCDFVRGTKARLVVVDSVGEAMGLDGINEDKDAEVTPWMRRVLRPLAATGAAVLPIDHGVKNGENPLHPSGSKRKRAQVSGSHFLVDAIKPLSQEFSGGRLKLTTAKDRHGNYTRGKTAAIIDIAIYPDGWTVKVLPPEVEGNAEDQKLLVVARAAVRAAKELYEETGEPPSLRLLEQAMKVKAQRETRRAGIELAVAKGALAEESGPRNARLFRFVKEFDPPDG